MATNTILPGKWKCRFDNAAWHVACSSLRGVAIPGLRPGVLTLLIHQERMNRTLGGGAAATPGYLGDAQRAVPGLCGNTPGTAPAVPMPEIRV